MPVNTFKGTTDEMLRWQTERFLELEESRSSNVVRVRPEQVVEIAFDGLQTSSRYPAGMAQRFARVVATATTRVPPRPTPSRLLGAISKRKLMRFVGSDL